MHRLVIAAARRRRDLRCHRDPQPLVSDDLAERVAAISQQTGRTADETLTDALATYTAFHDKLGQQIDAKRNDPEFQASFTRILDVEGDVLRQLGDEPS